MYKYIFKYYFKYFNNLKIILSALYNFRNKIISFFYSKFNYHKMSLLKSCNKNNFFFMNLIIKTCIT